MAPMVPVRVYLSGFDESAVKVEVVWHNDGSYVTGTVKCPYFGHLFDFATFFHSQKKFCAHYLLNTKHV
jgi:hypothetical protein